MAEEVGRLKASWVVDQSSLRRGLKKSESIIESWAKRNSPLEIEVKVDTSDLTRGLSSAARTLTAFRKRFSPLEIEVKVDDSGLSRGLQRAQASLKRFSRDASAKASLTVDADTSRAERGISDISRRLARLSASEANLKVSADISAAMRRLDTVSRRLKELSGSESNVRVDADTSRAYEKIRQFVKWVSAQRAEISVGANTQGAQRAAEAAKAYINRLNADIDVGAATRGAVRSSEAAARRIGAMSPEMDVGADTSGVQPPVQSAARMVSATKADVNVGADTVRARAELNGFNQVIRRYAGSWGQQGLRVRVQAETQRAQAQLRQLERVAREVTAPEHKLRIEAETARAHGRLSALQAQAAALGMQSPTISVNVRGAAASAASMVGLYALADRLDGYNIKIGASVDNNLSKAIPNMLGALEQQVLRFQSVITTVAAVAVPAFYASLAALPGVMAAAGGAVGSLAIGIGQGLVGAFGAAASAAVLGGGALGVFGASVYTTMGLTANLSDTINDYRRSVKAGKFAVEEATAALAKATPGTKEHKAAVWGLKMAEDDLADSQRELNATLQSITPATFKLNNAFDDLRLGMIKTKGEIANGLAPAMTKWVEGATRLLPTVTPHIVEMNARMADVVDTFIKVMNKGRELENLKTIFAGIKAAGVPAMQTLTNALRVFVNVFAAVVPTGLKVLDVLARLTGAAAKWTGTAEGQRRIAEVWAVLSTRAGQLADVALNLAAALTGVAIALNDSGMVDRMMNGVVRLSGAFRELMSASGGGRKAVTDFMVAAQPIFTALGDLAAGVGRGIATMVKDFINLRNASTGALVIVEVIDAINGALLGTKNAGGILGLLRHELEVIGPLLPGLITNLGEWFTIFALAEPEMVLFIKTFTRVLEAFNNLPEPVKRATARVIAWTTAINALGGGALANLAASAFATGVQLRMLGTQKQILAVQTAQLTVAQGAETASSNAGIIARTRATAALVAQRVALVATTVATRTAAAATWLLNAALYANPITLVVVALVALGVAFYLAYKHSETFRNAVDAVAEVVGGILVNAFENAKDAFDPVVKFFAKLGGAMLTNAINKIKEFAETVKSVLGPFFTWLAGKVEDSPGLSKIWDKLSDDKGAIQNTMDRLGPLFTWLAEKATNSPGLNKIWDRLSDDKGAIQSTMDRLGPLFTWIADKATKSPGLNKIWDKLRDDKGAIQNARDKVGQLITWIREKAAAMGTSFSSAWDSIKNIFNSALAAIGARVTKWRTSINDHMTNLATWAKGHWDRFWANLKSMWDRALAAIGDRARRWGTALRNLFTDLGNWAKNHWNGFWTNLKSMWDRSLTAIGDRARKWGDAIKSLFQRVKGFMVNPIESARDSLKSVWNSILSGVGKVLGVVPGLKDLAGKVTGAKWETGGTTEDGGGKSFARGGVAGGVVEKYAKGGMGTPSAKPRMHMWNEQQGGEAFVAEKRPAKEQLPYLQTAADWHGYAVIPAKPALPRHFQHSDTTFARGGVAPVVPYAIGGETSASGQAMHAAVKRKFGVDGFNRHASYLSQPGASRSIDWMVTAPGNRASGSQKSLGDNIAGYVAPPSTRATIWYGQSNWGGGWQPYSTGPGMGNSNTLGHYDHVHGEAHGSGFKGDQGSAPTGGGGGGGFSVPNPVQIAFEAAWKRFVKPRFDSAANAVDGDHALRKGAKGTVNQIRHGMYKWIDDKIPDTIGGGDGGESGKYKGGKNLEEWAKNGLVLGNVFPPTRPNIDAIKSRAMQESGGDPNAVNNWDSNAKAGTPSKGLMQLIEGTWNANTTSKIGQFAGNWSDPVKSVGVASRYMKSRYGKVVGSTGVGYAKGGVIPGAAGQPVMVQAHAGERVLPREVVTAFDRLARSIELWASRRQGRASPVREIDGAAFGAERGGPGVVVNLTVNNAQGMDEARLAEEVEARLGRKLQEISRARPQLSGRMSGGRLG